MNKRTMKKLSILGLLLFLTVNIYGQTKTHETEEFSVEYPANWELNTSGIGNSIFGILSPSTDEKDTFRENVNLITQNLQGNPMTLDQYAKLSRKQILTMIEKSEILEDKRVKNNSSEYHMIVAKAVMNEIAMQIMQFYIIENEKAYVLTYTAIADQYEKFVKQGSDIMKSFKLKK